MNSNILFEGNEKYLTSSLKFTDDYSSENDFTFDYIDDKYFYISNQNGKYLYEKDGIIKLSKKKLTLFYLFYNSYIVTKIDEIKYALTSTSDKKLSLEIYKKSENQKIILKTSENTVSPKRHLNIVSPKRNKIENKTEINKTPDFINRSNNNFINKSNNNSVNKTQLLDFNFSPLEKENKYLKDFGNYEKSIPQKKSFSKGNSINKSVNKSPFEPFGKDKPLEKENLNIFLEEMIMYITIKIMRSKNDEYSELNEEFYNSLNTQINNEKLEFYSNRIFGLLWNEKNILEQKNSEYFIEEFSENISKLENVKNEFYENFKLSKGYKIYDKLDFVSDELENIKTEQALNLFNDKDYLKKIKLNKDFMTYILYSNEKLFHIFKIKNKLNIINIEDLQKKKLTNDDLIKSTSEKISEMKLKSSKERQKNKSLFFTLKENLEKYQSDNLIIKNKILDIENKIIKENKIKNLIKYFNDRKNIFEDLFSISLNRK